MTTKRPHSAPPLPPTFIEVDEDGDETEHVGLGDLARAIRCDGRDMPHELWRQTGEACDHCDGLGFFPPSITNYCEHCRRSGNQTVDARAELATAIEYERDDLAKYAHGGRLIPRQED